MEIGEFEDKISQELEIYESIYSEYNRILEKTLFLVDKLRMRFKDSTN